MSGWVNVRDGGIDWNDLEHWGQPGSNTHEAAEPGDRHTAEVEQS